MRETFNMGAATFFVDDIVFFEALKTDFLVYLRSGFVKKFPCSTEDEAKVLWKQVNDLLVAQGFIRSLHEVK